MASMNGKRVAVVATLTASLMVMGGAALAAPATTTGLVPGPISDTHRTGRYTEAEAERQISQLNRPPYASGQDGGYTPAGLVPGPISDTHRTGRYTEAEAERQISQLNRPS